MLKWKQKQGKHNGNVELILQWRNLDMLFFFFFSMQIFHVSFCPWNSLKLSLRKTEATLANAAAGLND